MTQFSTAPCWCTILIVSGFSFQDDTHSYALKIQDFYLFHYLVLLNYEYILSLLDFPNL